MVSEGVVLCECLYCVYLMGMGVRIESKARGPRVRKGGVIGGAKNMSGGL